MQGHQLDGYLYQFPPNTRKGPETQEDIWRWMIDSGQAEVRVEILDEDVLDDKINSSRILYELNKQMNEAGLWPTDYYKEDRCTKLEIEKQPQIGPMFISPSDVIRDREKEMAIREARRKEAQGELISYMGKREALVAELPRLDIRKRKDALRITDINREIADLDRLIDAYKEFFRLAGVKYHTGNPTVRKIERVKTDVKTKIKKFWKKTKKFVKRNLDIICGVASVVVPMVVAAIFRKPAARLA